MVTKRKARTAKGKVNGHVADFPGAASFDLTVRERQVLASLLQDTKGNFYMLDKMRQIQETLSLTEKEIEASDGKVQEDGSLVINPVKLNKLPALHVSFPKLVYEIVVTKLEAIAKNEQAANDHLVFYQKIAPQDRAEKFINSFAPEEDADGDTQD